MRRCPQCRRDYYDESLIYCLDDGSALLDGPASGDEPTTAILHETDASGEAPTRALRSSETGTPGRPYSTSNPVTAAAICLAVIAVIGVGGYLFYGRAGARQIDSIAVMPFVNQSGNPDIEYLSDGMTEALMNSLDQVPDLNVKARSSVFRYKDKDVDVQTMGRELGVQAILNGRMVQRGDALTLFLELVDATTGDRIWGGQYDRKQSDLVSLHREIAGDVSEKLRSKLSGDEAKKIAKSDTANDEAYRLYMAGRFYWNKRRIGSMGTAIGYFQQAIDLDPNYARAYAGLADAVAQPNDVVPFPERAEKARSALVKALSIDPELAEAHTALGNILLRFNADFDGAERELSAALKLDPKWIDTYQRYSELYSYLGKHDDALTKCREGLAIEPFNIPLNASCGVTLTYARRYDEAITQLKKTVEMAPDHRNGHMSLATVYGLKGMYAEQVKHRIEALKLADQNEWAEDVREGFAKDGWPGALRAEIARFEKQGISPDRRPHYFKAAFLVALGENEAAFTELERSFESQETPNLVLLKTDPRFDPLRGDPRFRELLKKVGFPE